MEKNLEKFHIGFQAMSEDEIYMQEEHEMTLHRGPEEGSNLIGV